jgi:Cu2+-containing amine oxidase
MASTMEVVLTIVALSFWFLFPIGMFLSVSRVDKNTDQVIRLEQHEIHPVADESNEKQKVPEKKKVKAEPIDWHHPLLHFRRWLQH